MLPGSSILDLIDPVDPDNTVCYPDTDEWHLIWVGPVPPMDEVLIHCTEGIEVLWEYTPSASNSNLARYRDQGDL